MSPDEIPKIYFYLMLKKVFKENITSISKLAIENILFTEIINSRPWAHLGANNLGPAETGPVIWISLS